MRLSVEKTEDFERLMHAHGIARRSPMMRRVVDAIIEDRLDGVRRDLEHMGHDLLTLMFHLSLHEASARTSVQRLEQLPRPLKAWKTDAAYMKAHTRCAAYARQFGRSIHDELVGASEVAADSARLVNKYVSICKC
jgi:hypothetical protein